MSYSKRNNAICGIYKITNIVNNKVYIGESLSIKDRWWIHNNELSKNKHHSYHLQRSYNKYGKYNFKFEILEQCNKEELFIKQDKYILRYKSDNRKFGYNILKAGNKWSDEHMLRMKTIFNNSTKRIESNILSGINKRGIGKNVIKYSIDGKFICEYTSIKLAAESELLDKSCVGKCCKRKINKCGNFIFRYKDDKDVSIPDSKVLRKVISIDINNNETEYNSLSEAAKSIGCKSTSTIQSCCKWDGRRKTCKGLKWRDKL